MRTHRDQPDPEPLKDSMPRSERMSRVDTAWLRMDSDANLMMIVGIWLLGAAAATWPSCSSGPQEGLLAYPRFRQKVVEDAARRELGRGRRTSTSSHHVQRESLRVRGGKRRWPR